MTFTNPVITGIDPALVGTSAGVTPEQFFRRTYPSMAWILDIPELRNAAVDPINARAWDQILPALEATDWWKSRSEAVRKFDSDASDPAAQAEQNRQIDQRAARITMIARNYGTVIEPGHLRELAHDAVRFGWSDDELTLTIKGYGSEIAPAAPGSSIEGNMMLVRKAAHDQFLTLDAATVTAWARGISNGERTLDAFKTYAAEQAAYNRPELAGTLRSGATMAELTNSVQNQIAQIMGLDPSEVDFVNNPKWGKVVDYVPPGETTRRIMTQPEALAYARSLPEYRFTDDADAKAAALSTAINKAWGKM